MPAPNLSSYKVAASELSSSTKFNNLVQAIQDEFGLIDADQIPGFPSDASKFLRGDGTWATTGAATMATSLPGLPSDGQEAVLVDSTTAPTYQWQFRYISAKASNKWVFVGGTDLTAVVNAAETRGATYGDLTTVGPSAVIPVAGVYDLDFGFTYNQANATADLARAACDGAGLTAADADSAFAGYVGGSANTQAFAAQRFRRQVALTAATVKLLYKTTNTIANFQDRYLKVTPVAIGG